jgi:hypothetical protein
MSQKSYLPLARSVWEPIKMLRKLQHLPIFFGIFLIIMILGIMLKIKNYSKEEKIHVGIKIKTEEQRNLARKFFPKKKEINVAKYIEFTAGWKEFFILQQAGLEPELILEVNKQELIGSQFHTFSQVDSILLTYEKQYSSILNIEKIGESAFHKLPIKAIKISDFPLQNEGELSVLFTAAHHANEPLGVEICLYIVDYICRNYQSDQQIKKWVDNLEIWVVPVVNPDGYQIVFNDQSRIIWRKNLRDNNNDGKFTPEIDGVDLNRNYDYHWGDEGDRFPNSSFYPGPFPFSEPEAQAIRNLAERKCFVFHLDFHGAGELILYPFSNPQDEKVIQTVEGIARNIKKTRGGNHYSIAPMNDRVGQCSLWMYNELGVLSFTVEAGESYFPPAEQIKQMIEQNAKAVFRILNLITKNNSLQRSQRTLKENLGN